MQSFETRGLIIHDIMRKTNLLIALQLAKEDTPLSLQKFDGAWKLGRLWTLHDNPISAVIMSTSHIVLYWLYALNQSEFSL